MKLLCLLFAASLHVALSSAETCGISNPKPSGTDELRPRIINGDEVGYERYPWFAEVNTCYKNNCLSCGGALISERHVLTAGHCTDDYSKSDEKSSINNELQEEMTTELPVVVNASVRLGLFDEWNTSSSTANVITIASSAIKMHEEFYSNKNNDIALVTLSESAIGRTPICLPVRGYTQDSGYVIGFGVTENGSASCKLLEGKFNIMPKETCNPGCENTEVEQGVYSDGKMFCAIRLRGGISSGDSGGPFMIEDDGKYVLIGVASANRLIIEPDTYQDIFSDVYAHSDWIQSNMRDNGV